MSTSWGGFGVDDTVTEPKQKLRANERAKTILQQQTNTVVFNTVEQRDRCVVCPGCRDQRLGKVTTLYRLCDEHRKQLSENDDEEEGPYDVGEREPRVEKCAQEHARQRTSEAPRKPVRVRRPTRERVEETVDLEEYDRTKEYERTNEEFLEYLHEKPLPARGMREKLAPVKRAAATVQGDSISISGDVDGFFASLNDDEFLSKVVLECSRVDESFPFSSIANAFKAEKETLKKLAGSIVVIEGTVGAGKSYLCDRVHKAFKSHRYPSIVLKEYVEEKTLNWFLEDEFGNAFGFQLILLGKRLQTYELALKYKRRGYTVIVDRSLHGDMAFELMHYKRGAISELQHGIYLDRIMERSNRLNVPDYCIFLNVSVDSARTNIKTRGRPGELKVYTREYLSNLRDAYAFCLKRSNIPILHVEHDSDPRRTLPFPISAPTPIDSFDDAFMSCILGDLVLQKEGRLQRQRQERQERQERPLAV